MLRTPKFWQKKSFLARLLLPLSAIYNLISSIDLAQKRKKSSKLPIPVIVIGNINVGGTGKTPVTIALINSLQKRGLTVGVLSRGFGRSNNDKIIVNSRHTTNEIGDEPFLIFQKTQAPMAVYKDRYEAGIALLEANPKLDLIICDDALQHQQLQRDIEIIVIGKQGFGNGYLFPAGPLREPLSRLNSADFLVNNGFDTTTIEKYSNKPIFSTQNQLGKPYNLVTKEISSLQSWAGIKVTAIAGIAYPENFYSMLKTHGLELKMKSFPDHHQYVESDFTVLQEPVLMTEKDAVKCTSFNNQDLWVVPLVTSLPETFIDAIIEKIEVL